MGRESYHDGHRLATPDIGCAAACPLLDVHYPMDNLRGSGVLEIPRMPFIVIADRPSLRGKLLFTTDCPTLDREILLYSVRARSKAISSPLCAILNTVGSVGRPLDVRSPVMT